MQSVSFEPFQTEGKNRFYRLKWEKDFYLLKVFAAGERGFQSARREFEASHFLSRQGFERLPLCLGFYENKVVMEFLEGVRGVSSREAYRELKDFLRLTENFQVPWEVQDDRLDRLMERQGDLVLDGELKAALDDLSGFLNACPPVVQPPVRRRFLLSDFHPRQVVAVGAGDNARNFLLDLEDAGMGDPRRFLCNLCLHPQGDLTLTEAVELRDLLGLRDEEMESVFPFSYWQWTLILLNGFSKTRRQDEGPEVLERQKQKALSWMERAAGWRKSKESWWKLCLSEMRAL
jgi:hypothetical protein